MSSRPREAMLAGERCYLRPLRRDDVEGNWLHWFSDPEVTRYMLRGAFPTTTESQLDFYESVVRSTDDVVLAIIEPEGHSHIGNIGLHRIDWQHRSGEYGIVIGERDYWGRGIGSEATRLICDHGFRRLGLHRIWLGVFAEHEAAIAMYERVGFQVEATLCEAIFSDGRWHDQVLMRMLEGELR